MSIDWKKFEGQVVNKIFPLQNLLGSTNYSAVFLTQSTHEQPKKLAIKFVNAGLKADYQASLLQRASHLSHPNLFHLLPGGRYQLAEMDLVFVVMEYAEEDLGHVLRERPLTAKETRDMLGPFLDVLKYIHGKGFAHSHIKPSNIMAIGDHLKIAFDTVLPLGEPRPAYRPVDAYDPPEAGTALVAASSDVWSLGMTLVESLTQHPPASSPEKHGDPIIPPTLSQPFLDIARHCLRHDPRLRWTTEQIADCLNPAPIQAVAPAGKTKEPAAEMWQDITYTWVVLCKNYFFHMRQNLFFRHRIPLAYTDPFSPIPDVDRPFEVRCDDCGKTYVYKRSNLRRYQGEVPKFTTHPLF